MGSLHCFDAVQCSRSDFLQDDERKKTGSESCFTDSFAKPSLRARATGYVSISFLDNPRDRQLVRRWLMPTTMKFALFSLQHSQAGLALEREHWLDFLDVRAHTHLRTLRVPFSASASLIGLLRFQTVG